MVASSEALIMGGGVQPPPPSRPARGVRPPRPPPPTFVPRHFHTHARTPQANGTTYVKSYVTQRPPVHRRSSRLSNGRVPNSTNSSGGLGGLRTKWSERAAWAWLCEAVSRLEAGVIACCCHAPHTLAALGACMPCLTPPPRPLLHTHNHRRYTRPKPTHTIHQRPPQFTCRYDICFI